MGKLYFIYNEINKIYNNIISFILNININGTMELKALKLVIVTFILVPRYVPMNLLLGTMELEAVQLKMKRRKAFAKQYNISKVDYATVNNPFAGRVICGACGNTFGRKVWNSTDER